MRSVSFWGKFTSGSRIRASRSDLLKLPTVDVTPLHGHQDPLFNERETDLNDLPKTKTAYRELSVPAKHAADAANMPNLTSQRENPRARGIYKGVCNGPKHS